MKLLECHIENFGNICNADYKFDEKLTEFCEENGYGKTTLASFIKAMFYGLPPCRANSKEFSDRRHYYPFGGGKFGGSLAVEIDGAIYRIERFFGKKSEKDDTLTVYCNNKRFNGFGDDIGKSVFGLDKESFERTAFVNSDAIDICATGGISAKLNNFVDDLENGNNIDAIVGAIEKPKKDLKADRGDKGLISKTRQEILDLTDSIKNLEKIEQSLEQSYIEASELQRDISQQEAKVNGIKNRNIVIERWQRYETMSARKSSITDSLNELRANFPHGIPSESEIAEMKNYNQSLVSLSGKKAAAIFDEHKQKRLEELSAIFADGVPDDEYLRKIKSNIGEIITCEANLQALDGLEQSDRFDTLKQKFGKGAPVDSEIDRTEKLVDRYRTLDNMQKAQSNVAVDGQKNSASISHKFIFFAAIAAIIVACGIGLLFVNVIGGSVMLSVGVFGLFVIGFLYLKNIGLNRQAVVIDENAVKRQAEMRQIEDSIREFLTHFGYYSQNGLIFDFEIFKSDLKDYRQNLDKVAEKERTIREQRASADEKNEKVKAAFARYGIDDDDFQKAYLTLQNMVSVFITMKTDSEDIKNNQSRLVKEIEACKKGIESILSRYGIPMSENIEKQISDLAISANNIVHLNKDLSDIEAEIQEYCSQYGLTEKPAEEIIDVSDMEAQIRNNRQELARLESEISANESDVENLEDKRNQLENAEEKLEKYVWKYKILSAAINFLKTAEQNMKDKYIAPIRDNFLYYANQIETSLGEKISMDPDFNIMFERGGENRSDRHLSAGQRSICALCFRLALVNNMYENEKPFIIMDDPFVHLDEKHMDKTRHTVKELSKDNQIIYFSCHNSRKIIV